MSKYVCKVCGKLFDRVGNGVYCPGPHYRPCPICGKPVEYHRPKEPVKCCSKECSNKKVANTKRNNLEIRKCEICGKMYQPNDKFQKYCPGPHKTTCVICGKTIVYTCHPSDKPNTCSVECGNKLREQTCLDRTGYTNAAYIPESRRKISEANRPGGRGALKRKATFNATYGEGIDSALQVPDIIEHNKNLWNDPEYRLHRYDAYKERTGYDSPGSNPNVHKKRLVTRAEHGPYESFSRNIINHHMTDSSRLDDFLQFRKDPISYIQSNFSYKPTIDELRISLGVTDTPIYEFLAEHNASDFIEHTNRSDIELTIQRYIESLGVTVDPNNRQVIKPKEIDLWMPEYKIGIEYNPTFTHNSTIGGFDNKPKSRLYHKDKSDAVKSEGAFLFHIFGYEWRNKRAIIQSMIRNLFGKNELSIGARKLQIRDVSYTDACAFLNNNHLQGAIKAKVYIGLYTVDGELIAIMTFNHLRHTIGRTKMPKDDSIWELSRFCTKLNTSIPGGASKLLKYFINEYNPSKIISFSDDAHVRGTLYGNLGFVRQYTTKPRYVWVDKYDKTVYSRVSCQKNKLRKLFNDPEIDIEHKTEVEIMTEHGFLQVFDSGVTKWELNL